MAFIHPLVILAAVICGIYAGALGWKRFQYKRGKAAAPDFPWQRHIRWGRAFFILLCIGVQIVWSGVSALLGTLPIIRPS